MSTRPVSALNHETAIILLEEGRKQFIDKNYGAARASFKEAASFDPDNREVLRCLASVTDGEEQAQYLRRLARQRGNAGQPGLDTPHRRHTFSQKWILALAGLFLLLFVTSGAFAIYQWMKPPEPPTNQAEKPGLTTISPEKGGLINLNGQAGLLVPPGSLANSENFLLSFSSDAPAFPQDDQIIPVGNPLKVDTSATILRQQVWIGMRYDPAKLPANIDENSIIVNRWNGTSWETLESENHTDTHIVYVAVNHFSSPYFQMAAWAAPTVPSSLSMQLTQANKEFYLHPYDVAAAGTFEKIIKSYTSPQEIARLAPADQKSYWMACNQWAEALYNTARFDEAGRAFSHCVQIALDAGVKDVWNNYLVTSPAYSLAALQNRYPLGVELSSSIRSENLGKYIPYQVLSLYSDFYTWKLNIPTSLADLPTDIRNSIAEDEAALQIPSDKAISTSLDIMVLSSQAQAPSSVGETLNQTVFPFIQSSGIPSIPASAIKDSAQDLKNSVDTFLRKSQDSNRYISAPALADEEGLGYAPLMLVRVERIWDSPEGLTDSQYLFTIGDPQSVIGILLGHSIGQEVTYRNSSGQVIASTSQFTWMKVGSALVKGIQPVQNYDEQSMAAGNGFTCALTKVNGVQCWGENQSGQLGTNDNNNSAEPRDVVGLSYGISQITAGDTHACALTSEGKVFCWGNNTSGQLGNGDNQPQPIPVEVSGLASPVAMISAGAQHTCALTRDGKAYCWGNNIAGQLGDGTTNTSNAPLPVNGLAEISTLAAGGMHTCAITKSGEVSCWGSNAHGQLGGTDQPLSLTPVQVQGLENVTGLTAGLEHTCVVNNSAAVYCWGLNTAGQLGSASTQPSITTPTLVNGLESNVSLVKTFKSHTCALKDKEIFCWGQNNAGQLGNGDTTNQFSPVHVQLADTTFASVITGADHTCGRTINGFIACWGNNTSGQLGNRTTTSSVIPVVVTGFGTSLVDAKGRIEISPSAGQDIEMGVTLRIKANNISQDFPDGVQQLIYQLAYNDQPFQEIGRTSGTDLEGVSWKAENTEIGKKVVFKILAQDNQGGTVEYISNDLKIVDTRKPTAQLVIDPPNHSIELGSSVVFSAKEVNDAIDGVIGSGVREVTFKVFENGAETFSNTQPFVDGKDMQVTWPVPLSRKYHHTLVDFTLTVVDNAGNEENISDSGYMLLDTLAPSFVSDITISAEKLSGLRIEMGSKVTATVDVSDLYQGGKQGSGIRQVDFLYSVDGGAFTIFSSQVFNDQATLKSVSSQAWDSTGTEINKPVVFKARISDLAGNVSEKNSALYQMDDTTPPAADSTITMEGLLNSSALLNQLKLSATGLTDGPGSGVAKAWFVVTCSGHEIYNGEQDSASMTGLANGSPISQTSSAVDAKNCAYNQPVNARLVIEDKNGKRNDQAATGSTTCKYDKTNPSGSIGTLDKMNNTYGSPDKPYSIQVNVVNDPGGSPITEVDLAFTCNNGSAQSLTPVTGTIGEQVTFHWTPACGWNLPVTFTATIIDTEKNTFSTQAASTNYLIDTVEPDIQANTLQGPISQPVSINGSASDSGSGLADFHLAVGSKGTISSDINADGSRTINIPSWPAPGKPMSGVTLGCGNIDFVWSATDRADQDSSGNTAHKKEIVNSVNYQFNQLVGSLQATTTADDGTTLYKNGRIDLTASVAETCYGIDHATYTILDITKQVSVTVPASIEPSDTAVTITASWRPPANPVSDPFEPGDQLKVSLKAFSIGNVETANKLTSNTIWYEVLSGADIPEQEILEDTSTNTISFSVNNKVNVTASSGDANVVPNDKAHITLGGSGANSTIKITPAPDQNGWVTITLTLTYKNTTFPNSFLLKVRPVNDAPSFTKGGNLTGAGDGQPRSVAGWATNIRSGPANESGQKKWFNLTTDNDALFDLKPEIDPNGTLTFTPKKGADGTANVSVYLQDDGGTADGGFDTSLPQTFTLTLRNPVVITEGPGPILVSLDEDGISTAFPFTLQVNDPHSANLNWNISSPAAKGTANVTALGVVDYTPNPNENGSDSFTVTVSDGLSSDSLTFNLTINPVNDAPSFIKGADMKVPGDGKQQVRTGWATNIKAGPADETGQTWAFKLIPDDTSLFDVQPDIDKNGTLTFTPKNGAQGVVLVTVTLSDSGDTANNGADTSDPQTFTITIQ
jgi:alpha-tubulin suppressor-like RCC1 family protein